MGLKGVDTAESCVWRSGDSTMWEDGRVERFKLSKARRVKAAWEVIL